MYIDKDFIEILEIISKEEYVSSYKISQNLQISEKTARLKIKNLSEMIEGKGAVLKSKKGKGYNIEILNKEEYDNFIDFLNNEVLEQKFNLLLSLLWKNDYIKVEEIMDKIYISKYKLSKELKFISDTLTNYKLELDRRSNYGILIKGEEFRKRMLLLYIYNKKKYKDNELYNNISEIVLKLLQKNYILISDNSFKNINMYIIISIQRIKSNFNINYISQENLNTTLNQTCCEIYDSIQQKFDLTFNEEEKHFLGIFLNSQLSSSTYKLLEPNLNFEKKIDSIVDEIFNNILDAFQVDYREDLEMKKLFIKHMIPLHNRLIYNIKITNPLLDIAKTEYTDCYMIAIYACSILKKYYPYDISEDEIGYFTMLFACAKEIKEKKINKKNILIISTQGEALSKLFLYKYKDVLEKYVQNIYEYKLNEIDTFDFDKVDYIFITSKINFNFPRPCFNINILLKSSDIINITNIFKNSNDTIIDSYYKKELFINNIKETEKEKVLKVLFENCKKYYDIDDKFYNSVLERENLDSTDFLEKVAILHPLKSIYDYNFISVGILDTPIFWGKNYVEIVFLICISIDNCEYLENFYNITTKFLFDKEKIDFLIENPSFETLHFLLNS